MKTASVYKELSQVNSKSMNDSKILSELIEMIIYKVDQERSIEWTPENLMNFLLFLFKQPHFIINFQDKAIEEILNTIAKDEKLFNLAQFSTVTHVVSQLFPDKHEPIWKKLLEKFAIQTRFDYFSIDELVKILNGVFIMPKSEISQSAEAIPSTSLVLLRDEIINKIRIISANECQAHLITKALTNFPGDFRDKILEALAEKIFHFIESNPEFIGENEPFGFILNTYQALLYFYPATLAVELFKSLNSRVFLHNFIRSQTRFSVLSENNKAMLLSVYLANAARFNVFEVVSLDYLVAILNEEMNKKYIKRRPDILADCLSNLAYLNYPSRFNVKIPHKQTQWLTWQTILARTEDVILGSAHSNIIEEPNEIQASPSVKNINFLWALCVFDSYSKSVIQQLACNIDPSESFSTSTYKKLFQIHYWLKTENFGEFSLESRLLIKMYAFKEKWDSTMHLENSASEMKDIVRNTIITDKYQFKENVHDFPYFFDFTHNQEKSAIIIDDDEQFLEGTELSIRSGFHKVMSRQLVNLGWSAKKISIRNWLNICNSDILPR